MKKSNIFSIAALVVLVMLSSCRSDEAFVYMHDMVPGEEYPIKLQPEATIQPNDKLIILVECPSKPELAIPFKIRQGSYQINDQGNITIHRTNAGEENCYIVDEKGYIDFPVLGRFSVEDMTLEEAKEFLAEAITETGLIRNPFVEVKFQGFKYTVIGAIGGKGVKTTDTDKFTLLEAIANGGDLPNNARLDRICVIREENGARQIYYTDIRTKDFFDSPVYYLRPNDIIYVEPKYRQTSFGEKALQYVNLGLSGLSTITSIIYWTTIVKNLR